MSDTISAFFGHYRFLSNFYPAQVVYNGYVWPTAEHAYQAAKTTDPVKITQIVVAPTPGLAKQIGRSLELRPGFLDDRVRVMEDIVSRKFNNVDNLGPGDVPLWKLLLMTHPRHLVEGNSWGDTFWGVCRGVGENHLGQILMRVRQSLL